MASRNGFRSHGLLDDNQNVLRTFSYYPGVDKPHSVMTDTATYYYATDPTGSVIGLAEYDGAPSVVNHYRYDVWGMPQGNETEGAENPLRFKARWWDEDTELLDFRSRWYDPEIGRFISEDPIGLAGGINVYRFANNNPIAGWDPYGLDPDDPDCEASAGVLVGYTESGVPIFANGVECEQGPGPSPFGGGDTFGDPIGPRPPPSPSKGGPPGSGGPGPGPDDDPDIDTQCIAAWAGVAVNGALDVLTFVGGAGAAVRVGSKAFGLGLKTLARQLPQTPAFAMRRFARSKGHFVRGAAEGRAAKAAGAATIDGAVDTGRRIVEYAPGRALAAAGIDAASDLLPILATRNALMDARAACSGG